MRENVLKNQNFSKEHEIYRSRRYLSTVNSAEINPPATCSGSRKARLFLDAAGKALDTLVDF
jgi:hypothetical protein